MSPVSTTLMNMPSSPVCSSPANIEPEKSKSKKRKREASTIASVSALTSALAPVSKSLTAATSAPPPPPSEDKEEENEEGKIDLGYDWIPLYQRRRRYRHWYPARNSFSGNGIPSDAARPSSELSRPRLFGFAVVLTLDDSGGGGGAVIGTLDGVGTLVPGYLAADGDAAAGSPSRGSFAGDGCASRMSIAEATVTIDEMSPKEAAATMDGLPLKELPTPSPPREARAGFAWRLLPDGHWQEKQKRKKKKDKKVKQHKDKLASPYSPWSLEGNRCGGVVGGSRSPSIIRAFSCPRRNSHQCQEEQPPQIQSPTSGSVTSTARPSLASRSTTTEKDKGRRGSGLYRRSMQFIRELRRSSATNKSDHPHQPPNTSDSDSTKSRTRVLLEKTSSLLRASLSIDGGLNNRHRRTATSRTPSPSGESGSSSRHTIYHRILRRHGTGLSKSSSVLNILMGKPPVTTPASDAIYSSGNRNDYFKVEISDPDGPSFLPSEATRVGTPPLPSDRPRKGNLRGFFFDYGSPGGESFISDSDSESHLELHSAGRSSTMESNVRLPFQFHAKVLQDEYRPFELNVPEHFPGSPLCPRSPLHPSGGRGICVYHGRTKTLPIPD